MWIPTALLVRTSTHGFYIFVGLKAPSIPLAEDLISQWVRGRDDILVIYAPNTTEVAPWQEVCNGLTGSYMFLKLEL